MSDPTDQERLDRGETIGGGPSISGLFSWVERRTSSKDSEE